MKIAFINNQPAATGVGRYASTLYRMVSDYTDADHYFIDRDNWTLHKTTSRGSELIYRAKKNPLFNDPLFVKHKLILNLLLDYKLGFIIPDSYDLYHITNQNLSMLSYYPKIKTKVLTVHDILYLSDPVNYFQKIIGNLVYKGIKSNSFIISISHSTKYDLIKYYKIPEERIKVIHHGVDRFLFRPIDIKKTDDIYDKYDLDKNSKYILHIGRDEPRKNLSLLIRAMYLLVNIYKMKNIMLLKINSMDKKTVNNFNMQNYVKIIDCVKEEELPKFYNLAALLLLPSYYEGFGFPALEAMACGTPVVASNTSSLPEVVGDAGILLGPDDAEGFADAIYKVLTDESLGIELAKKGIERVKEFSWEEAAKKTVEVYRQVAGE